jgi:hypothetical protein
MTDHLLIKLIANHRKLKNVQPPTQQSTNTVVEDKVAKTLRDLERDIKCHPSYKEDPQILTEHLIKVVNDYKQRFLSDP